ncbi:MAG: alpha/beta fold hydrolase [Pararhodobacter sp.]
MRPCLADLSPAPLAECGGPPPRGARRGEDAARGRGRRGPWAGGRAPRLLPGRTEYIEKYGLVARDLAAAGWGTLVVDWRGQGLADRALGDGLRGHVGDFNEFQSDLDALLEAARTLTPGPMPWLAHSMGGCIALRGLIRGQRPPAIAFSAPMFGLSQPATKLRALGLWATLARRLGADSGYAPTTGPVYGLPHIGFDKNPLTTDRGQFDRMTALLHTDPRLTIAGPSLRWMGAALREMAALARRPSPPVPAVFGLGGDEAIVSPAAIRARVATWDGAELVDYPGARHELMMERPEVRDSFLARALALFNRQTS